MTLTASTGADEQLGDLERAGLAASPVRVTGTRSAASIPRVHQVRVRDPQRVRDLRVLDG